MRKMQYKHVPQPRKSRGSNKYEKSTRFVAAGCLCLSANLAANKMERQNCKWKALIKLQVICIKCSDEKNHKNCCRSRAAHPLTTIQLQLCRKKKTAVRQWKTLAAAVATTTNLRNWRPKPNKTKQNERKIKEKKYNIIVHTFSVSISRSMKCVDDARNRRLRLRQRLRRF